MAQDPCVTSMSLYLQGTGTFSTRSTGGKSSFCPGAVLSRDTALWVGCDNLEEFCGQGKPPPAQHNTTQQTGAFLNLLPMISPTGGPVALFGNLQSLGQSHQTPSQLLLFHRCGKHRHSPPEPPRAPHLLPARISQGLLLMLLSLRCRPCTQETQRGQGKAWAMPGCPVPLKQHPDATSSLPSPRPVC